MGSGSIYAAVDEVGRPLGPRRDAVIFMLSSGHLALFGGNDGRFTDAFGDGYHQYGCKHILVADTVGRAPGEVGEWRQMSQMAPESTSLGCAVVAMSESSEIVVVDGAEDSDTLSVYLLALRGGAPS